MHVLQVCNVGSIVGGTAACAWSLTRAWPHMQHTVAFLSPVDNATRECFRPHQVLIWSQCTSRHIAEQQPDLVILHNIAQSGVSSWSGASTIQYIHSAGPRFAADHTIYCSQWLARQCRAAIDAVLWQGVPAPPSLQTLRTRFNDRPRVGRICTPSARKWPDSLTAFYSHLAVQHPKVEWEFIGCPASMQSRLREACHGQASFIPAGWSARSHLWEWDALLYHHPTLTESFGRTLAEAARAGCIPVVDHRGGFSEQLSLIDGKGCRTPSDFSDAIAALTDPSQRRNLSRKIQSQADTAFSITAFSQRLCALVDRLVSQQHAESPSLE